MIDIGSDFTHGDNGVGSVFEIRVGKDIILCGLYQIIVEKDINIDGTDAALPTAVSAQVCLEAAQKVVEPFWRQDRLYFMALLRKIPSYLSP